MGKPKKYLVELNGVKTMEAAIVAIGGEPYNEAKRTQLGLLGILYSMRTTDLQGHEEHMPISVNLTPEEFALVEKVGGIRRIK